MVHVVPSTPAGRTFALTSTVDAGCVVDDAAYDHFLNEVYLGPYQEWYRENRPEPRYKVDVLMDGKAFAEWRAKQPRWHVYDGMVYRYNVVAPAEIILMRLRPEDIAAYMNAEWALSREPIHKRLWRAFRGQPAEAKKRN